MARFFSQRGVFRHTVHVTDGDADKQYEITYAALARYFHTHFESGIERMQFIIESDPVDRQLPLGQTWVENKASFVYWFDTGSHLIARGSIRASFDAEEKLDVFEFVTHSHEEYLLRRRVVEAVKPSYQWIKEWHNLNQADGKQSPEISKKGKAKPTKAPNGAPPEINLPAAQFKANMGITEAVFQFLEVSSS